MKNEEKRKVDCEYFFEGKCKSEVDLIAIRGDDCRNKVKDVCCYTCNFKEECKISCDFMEAEEKDIEDIQGLKKEESVELSSIGWGRSFFIAFKSMVIGFLIALIWITTHIFISFALFTQFYHQSYYPTSQIDLFRDLSYVVPNSIITTTFPFTSILRIFTQTTYGYFSAIGGIILDLFISFLVYASFFAPIIKFSSDEAGNFIPWKRSFILGIKSALVGVILSVIFFVFGALCIIIAILSSYYSIPFAVISFFLAMILIAILICAAPTAAIIRFTTKEVDKTKNGVGWGRSFLVALKASVMALLWTVLFVLVFLAFLFLIMAASFRSGSPEVFGASLVMLIALFIVMVFLCGLAPTASVIKYLVEEINKFP